MPQFRALTLMATLLASVTTLPASYASAQEVAVTRSISTEGLDLSSPADQAKLQKTIARLSRRVCEDATSGVNTHDAGYADCVQNAYETAWSVAETRIAQANKSSMLASAKPR